MARRRESDFVICTVGSLARSIGAVAAGTVGGVAFLGTKGTVAGDAMIRICALITLAGLLWIPISALMRLTCMLVVDALDRHPGVLKASFLAVPVGIAAALVLR